MSKHLTNREIAARKQAEQGLRRARVTLRAPEWLSPSARAVWDGVKKKARKLDLLDNLDAEMLAVYCDALAHYQAATRKLQRGDDPAEEETVKQAQSWVRLISAYAEKLGLSPNARARLAKKKAEGPLPDDMELLLGEVTEYVNGEQ